MDAIKKKIVIHESSVSQETGLQSGSMGEVLLLTFLPLAYFAGWSLAHLSEPKKKHEVEIDLERDWSFGPPNFLQEGQDTKRGFFTRPQIGTNHRILTQGNPCNNDADCKRGRKCLTMGDVYRGMCVKVCQTAADCGDGWDCRESGGNKFCAKDA